MVEYEILGLHLVSMDMLPTFGTAGFECAEGLEYHNRFLYILTTDTINMRDKPTPNLKSNGCRIIN